MNAGDQEKAFQGTFTQSEDITQVIHSTVSELQCSNIVELQHQLPPCNP